MGDAGCRGWRRAACPDGRDRRCSWARPVSFSPTSRRGRRRPTSRALAGAAAALMGPPPRGPPRRSCGSRSSGRDCRRGRRGSRRCWDGGVSVSRRRPSPACPGCRSRIGPRRSRRKRPAAGGRADRCARPSTVVTRAPVAIERQRQAGAHRLAVDQHRAGAANALIAAALRAGQRQLIAQHREQRRSAIRRTVRSAPLTLKRAGLAHAARSSRATASAAARRSMRGMSRRR